MTKELPSLKNHPDKLMILNRIVYEQFDKMRLVFFVDLAQDIRFFRHFVNHWAFKNSSAPGSFLLNFIDRIDKGLWANRFFQFS